MNHFLPALFKPIKKKKKEAAILAIIRKTAQEQTGIFYQKGENLYVAEYTEVPSSIKEALSLDGNLLYQWANISVLCINPLMIDTLATLSLPIHKAKKIRNNQIIFKQEYFIFDTFPFLKSFALISLDRTKWFSPIKAKEGEDSLEKAAIAFERLQEEQARNASLFSNESKRASDIDPAILYGLPR